MAGRIVGDMVSRRGGAVLPPARALLADGALAALVGAVSVLFVTRAPLGEIPPDPHTPLDARAYALMGAATCALLVRSVWPLATFAVTAGAVTASLIWVYPYTLPLFVALVISMYSLAARWPIHRSVGACGVALLGFIGGHMLPQQEIDLVAQLPQWFIGGAAWLVTPWAIGVVVSIRRETTARGREEEIRRHTDEERLRIAREVHDIVGHRLAAINMQAGVALHVLERRPEQAGPALEAIKKSSKDALDELRGTLAVFRQPGGPEDAEAPTRPTPGLAQLDTLISGTRDAGLAVDLEVTDIGPRRVLGGFPGDGAADSDGSATVLPAAVDVAAYRIVQESLTNVLRHAGPAAATVRITYEPGEVLVEVTDDGRARPDADVPAEGDAGGHGIAGMRERASALGGTLDAGPRAEGGFRVHARLPAVEPLPAGDPTARRPGES